MEGFMGGLSEFYGGFYGGFVSILKWEVLFG